MGTHRLDTQILRNIAREMNLSQTIFVTDLPDPNHAYTVRLFTTEQELPFAGHPTIGSFYVLQRHGYLKADGFQLSPAGVTRLSMDSQHVIWFSPPPGMVQEIKGSWGRLAAALSLEIALMSYNIGIRTEKIAAEAEDHEFRCNFLSLPVATHGSLRSKSHGGHLTSTSRTSRTDHHATRRQRH